MTITILKHDAIELDPETLAGRLVDALHGKGLGAELVREKLAQALRDRDAGWEEKVGAQIDELAKARNEADAEEEEEKQEPGLTERGDYHRLLNRVGVPDNLPGRVGLRGRFMWLISDYSRLREEARPEAQRALEAAVEKVKALADEMEADDNAEPIIGHPGPAQSIWHALAAVKQAAETVVKMATQKGSTLEFLASIDELRKALQSADVTEGIRQQEFLRWREAHPDPAAWTPTHQHWKGDLYRVTGRGILTSYGEAPCVFYDNRGGEKFVRLTEEFDGVMDGGERRYRPIGQPGPLTTYDASNADDLREQGLMVAIHNDYRTGDGPRTFWLMTHKDGWWAKGEGRTDAEALNEIRGQHPRF